MSVTSAVNQHKTKALGIATAVLGFVQAYPGLSDLLSAQQYAWSMFAIGIGVTICGFLNSHQEQPSA